MTVIVPPVADGAMPVVAAESVPPFCSATVSAKILMCPPAPVPAVLVKTPLPVPSIRTEAAGLAKPWILIVPPAPDGIIGVPKSGSTPLSLGLLICPPLVR